MTSIESQEYYDNLTVQSLVESETPLNVALRERRKKLGLGQQQLAELVGLKRGVSISSYEVLRYFPNSVIAGKIANVLGTTPEELFPEWLKLFTEDQNKSADFEVEVVEADMYPTKPEEVYQIAKRFEPNFTIFNVKDPHILTEIRELREKLGGALTRINPIQKRVLQLRYGLEDGEERTLKEVAKEFGVTRERIRQIECKALCKLRNPSKAYRLRDFWE